MSAAPAPISRRPALQAAAAAALSATLALLWMAFGAVAPEPGLSLQPSAPAGTAAEFLRPLTAYPGPALSFFAADNLFVISYLVVFAGWFSLTRRRAPLLALAGLAAGLLTALADAWENAFFVSYALQALRPPAAVPADLTWLYTLTQLKWLGSFAAVFIFGLIWPRSSWPERVVAGLMLAYPLVGILGVAVPALAGLRGLFFLIAMPLFSLYFWRAARQAA